MADLDDELRRANPLASRRSSPPSARAERELSALLARTPEPAPKPRGRNLGLVGFAAAASIAMLVAALFALTDFGRAVPGSVAAPPQLVTTPLGDDLGEVLTELAARARAQPAPVTLTQTVSLETWSAQVEADSPVSSYYVQPEEVDKNWVPDRSGSWKSCAGDVRYGVPGPRDSPLEPGTTLRDDAYGPGDFPLAFPDTPPDDALELDTYIRGASALPARPETIDYFAAIEGMRYDRTLTGPQTAAALDLLGRLPDVTLAGTVTDRLGRQGIAIQTERSSGTHRMLLIFSPESGLLISSESVYLGGIADYALNYPTVLNYFAWKDQS
jgi:hypothetical protein